MVSTVAANARNLVWRTVTQAKGGDVESIGWVLVIVLAILLGFIAFTQTVFGDVKQAKAKRKGKAVLPPTYYVGLPLVGNIVAFARNPLALVWEAYAKKGEVFTIRFAHLRLTFVIGPAASEAFFKASDTQLDQNEPYRFSTPVFGKDVVYDATLENRLQHFRVLSMTLRVNMLEMYVPMMIKEAEEFFDKWGDEGEVDLFKELSDLIILTGSRCILGREVREHLFGEVSHLIHDLDQGMQPISVIAPYFPTAAHRQRDRARKRIAELFEPVIAARRASSKKEDDMLQWLVDATHKDGTPFSQDEIVGNLIAGVRVRRFFFGCLVCAILCLISNLPPPHQLFAAQHTSSATSTWLGMRMLRDQDYYQRVQEEQSAVMSAFDNSLCYGALVKMDSLHAAMKETLRMHPPLIFLMRKVLQPRLALHGKFVIPKNDYIVVSPSVAGMLPEIYAQPNKWDPERFLLPREEDKVAPYSFLGFGAGRHGCMGEGFAYVQVKTIWSVLMRKFHMHVVDQAMPEPNFSALVVGPYPGTCKMRYKRKST